MHVVPNIFLSLPVCLCPALTVACVAALTWIFAVPGITGLLSWRRLQLLGALVPLHGLVGALHAEHLHREPHPTRAGAAQGPALGQPPNAWYIHTLIAVYLSSSDADAPQAPLTGQAAVCGGTL